ncbi:hypothetical protein HMSSN036_04350 [Paenibacillus macerans]|nr:hypothetical protein HMSSN036_04350 [Paenibacillus macerans]
MTALTVQAHFFALRGSSKSHLLITKLFELAIYRPIRAEQDGHLSAMLHLYDSIEKSMTV